MYLNIIDASYHMEINNKKKSLFKSLDTCAKCTKEKKTGRKLCSHKWKICTKNNNLLCIQNEVATSGRNPKKKKTKKIAYSILIFEN